MVLVKVEVTLTVPWCSLTLQKHLHLPILVNVCFHLLVGTNYGHPLQTKWYKLRNIHEGFNILGLVKAENLVTVLLSWNNLYLHCADRHLVSADQGDFDFSSP